MMLSPSVKTSPMMAQWHECKVQVPDAILLFRLGDFYEAFYEDAHTLSKELNVTLTKRQDVPMSGIPQHTVESYIDKLVAKGFRVAIAEQTEDPKQTKGLVKREIVRIVTPGSLITSGLLQDKSNNFLCCIAQLNATIGLAIIDLSTAEFKVIETDNFKELTDELTRLSPTELVVSEKLYEKEKEWIESLKHHFSFSLKTKEEWYFDHRHCLDLLLKHFKVLSLDGFGLKGMTSAINAAGCLFSYLTEDLRHSLAYITSIQTQSLSAYMSIDRTTQRHLEITESLHDRSKTSTLLHHLDRCYTPMGGRLLKQWVTHPLLSCSAINERQSATKAIIEDPFVHDTILQSLREIKDLERLIMRVETGHANPRDLLALRYSLEQVPPLVSGIKDLSLELLTPPDTNISALETLTAKIAQAIVEDPPLKLSEGGVFQVGYHKELDEITSLKADSHSWIVEYQNRLREETGIKTLKVGYSKAFGYFIEVSRGQAKNMPLHFHRRQTLVNAERFITEELKDYEHKILSAEEKISAIELELFNNLRLEISNQAACIRQIAHWIATVDCLSSFATVSRQYGYVCPTVNEGASFEIVEGKHPVIEAALQDHTFIANDTFLNNTDQKLLLITGPNMAGKSTYIRQVALIAIMAQIGCFVPAKSATIGIVDKVFSRIGASDDLSRGQSTFMVEMTETANILNNATDRSLVILDEIGRGTSTYDGISIAWAVAQYLLTTPGKSPKTLFATHYWELTAMEKEIPGAVNYNVAVHESDKGIVFLRKIIKGSTDKSYGIHVAKLAGLPLPVIRKAQEMLAKMENGSALPSQNTPSSQGFKKKKALQLDFFAETEENPMEEKILQELLSLELDHLTPVMALQKLVEWKNTLS